MKKDIEISDNSFEEEVIKSAIPVLVDFWGSWCLPSQMMIPILKELSLGYEGKVKIRKLNVDQNPKTRDKYKILGCPTFILFKKGAELTRKVGAHSKAQLRDIIETALR